MSTTNSLISMVGTWSYRINIFGHFYSQKGHLNELWNLMGCL